MKQGGQKMRYKNTLILSVILNTGLVLFWIGKRIYYNQPVKESTAFADSYDSARNQLFDRLPIDSNDIVFVGNSITEGFPVTEIFGPDFKNRGIGSNRLYHVKNRIGKIIAQKPKAIYLLIGINDITSKADIFESACIYQEIIDSILACKITLYISPVFPVCGKYSNLTDSVNKFNSLIIEQAKSKPVVIVDLRPALSEGGFLISDYTYDGLHLNGKGYLVWRNTIRNQLP